LKAFTAEPTVRRKYSIRKIVLSFSYPAQAHLKSSRKATGISDFQFSLFMASLECYCHMFLFCVQADLFGRQFAILITYILHAYCRIRVAGKLFHVNKLLTLSPNFSNNTLAYSTKCGMMKSLANPPRSCRN